jgi:peptide/nickel transport system permease protein
MERRNASLLAGGLLVVLVALAAVLGPGLVGGDPFRMDLARSLAAPAPGHWLGCDVLGRDLLARLVAGARLSLGVATAVVGFSLLFGSIAGGLAGVLGAAADAAIMRLVDVLLAFPGFLLALGLVAVLGPGLPQLVVALTAMGWTGYARLVRGELLSLREREYVVAARALGARTGRLLFVHLLPALLGPLMVQASFGFGGIIVAEAGLSFLGLGVPPPAPSWGSLLDSGRAFLLVAPRLSTAPALAIGLSVLGFNLLGDGLARRFGLRSD